MLSPKQAALVAQIKTMPDVTVDVPGFVGELDPHQNVGVAFMVVGEKVLLLDYVGAGKTVMSIAADLKIRSRGDIGRTLVVCTTQRWQWEEEYQKFSGLRTCLVKGTRAQRVNCWLEGQACDVTISHYGAVRGDIDFIAENCGFDLIIFDEATEFKTHDTKLADSLRKLIGAVKPRFVFGLTATPVEKRLEELFSIMEKVVPGLLGDYATFMDAFVIQKKVTAMSRNGRAMTFVKTLGYRNIDTVKAWIMPYCIRRTKEMVGATLRRVSNIRYVELGSKQRAMYNSVSKNTDPLKKWRLQEMAVDTLANFDPNDHTSAKIDDLMRLLTGDLSDEKVLVFAKFHKPLDEAKLRCEKEGIGYISFSGREDQEEREKSRRVFQNDPKKVYKVAFITKAAYRGLNFHAARYIIFLNHYYNPAVEEQLIGRIDRPKVQLSSWIGVIKLVAKDTHEERMLVRMDKERELFKELFGDLAVEEVLSPQEMQLLMQSPDETFKDTLCQLAAKKGRSPAMGE